MWSDAQGEPEKVLVFPYEYRGYVSAAEDGTVSVNGSVVSRKAKTTETATPCCPSGRWRRPWA